MNVGAAAVQNAMAIFPGLCPLLACSGFCLKNLTFLRGFERNQMKKIGSIFENQQKILLYFSKLARKLRYVLFWKTPNLDSAKIRIQKSQNYRIVGLGNPLPTTYCLSPPADEEKSKAAFVCRFRNKIKATNSWQYPFSKSWGHWAGPFWLAAGSTFCNDFLTIRPGFRSMSMILSVWGQLNVCACVTD